MTVPVVLTLILKGWHNKDYSQAMPVPVVLTLILKGWPTIVWVFFKKVFFKFCFIVIFCILYPEAHIACGQVKSSSAGLFFGRYFFIVVFSIIGFRLIAPLHCRGCFWQND